MGPCDLEDIINSINYQKDNSVIIDIGDDAGVQLINDTAIVETVDVISPAVDNPFVFGAISAINSLSDIYAMGATPKSSLAIAGFPSCDYKNVVLKEIMKGAMDSLHTAKVALIGGHTYDNPEIRFGLSVVGVVNKNKILRVSGAKDRDVIILTKPIGSGIMTTAFKGRKISETEFKQSVDWMLKLNDVVSNYAVKVNATSCTDVTGFGLLGHLFDMIKNSDVDFIIFIDKVPVLDSVFKMIDAGMVPEGAYNNLKFFGDKVDFANNISEEEKILLADPQTSGGLLITLKEEDLKIFQHSKVFFSLIGRVVKGSGNILFQK